MNSIEDRLQTLEDQARFWRGFALAASALFLVSMVLGAHGPSELEVLEARGVRIVDEDGGVLLELRGNEQGGELEVFSGEGTRRAYLGSYPDIPVATQLVLEDSQGESDVRLLCEPAGPDLMFNLEQEAAPQAWISLFEGSAWIGFKATGAAASMTSLFGSRGTESTEAGFLSLGRSADHATADHGAVRVFETYFMVEQGERRGLDWPEAERKLRAGIGAK